MFTSKSIGLVALLAVLALACPTFADIVLSLDFNAPGPPESPTQSGFTGVDTTSSTFGAITVTLTNAFLFDDGGPTTGALPDLYRDFAGINGSDTFTVEIDGLLLDTAYQLRLYSYQNDAGTVATTFTPVPGKGAGASSSVTYTGGNPATTDDQYSTLVTWTTNSLGQLAFTGDGNEGAGGGQPRLNGLILSVPEPASLGLLAVGVGPMLLRRRRAVVVID